MIDDIFPAFPTLNLTQLGKLFNVSSHVIGRWLKSLGLRHANGEPTEQAVESGHAVLIELDSGTHPFWAWDKERTVETLVQAGHKRPSVQVSPASPHLTGPFASQRRRLEGDEYGIADANGVVAISVTGEKLANFMVKLLNLCHQHGVPLPT